MFQQDEDVPEILAVLISRQSVVGGGVAVRKFGQQQPLGSGSGARGQRFRPCPSHSSPP
jgi:hypothetical protein